VVVALPEPALDEASRELRATGAKLLVISGDIAKPELSHEIVRRTLAEFHGIDVLVNCAGMITRAPVETLSLEDWFRVIDVNLHGAFHLSRAVLPTMRAQKRGKIINITSQMARLPHPGASPSYEVSKAGLTALTRHLAYRFAKEGICVNAIAPGSINTDLPKSMSEEAREKIKSGIPMGRLGEPSEVADLALFLASSMSDYITGSTLDINGGSLMN
jgi:3-oxoacyl-[acyl-carrier protein] reductase